jgi:hypothetical protein
VIVPQPDARSRGGTRHRHRRPVSPGRTRTGVRGNLRRCSASCRPDRIWCPRRS